MKTLTPPTKPELGLRWMVHLDMSPVLRISRQRAGLHWQEEDFLEHLRSLHTIGLVAESDESVSGFIIYQIRHQPLGEKQVLHIDLLNIMVSPERQRQGIGRTMLTKLERKIQREGGCIRAAVPESNLPAQLFLRDAGYRATKILRDYYDEEDAYLMERRAYG